MSEIECELASNYFKRLYVAVDGMWYMMVERHFGLEKAVQIDKEVWEVIAKIAARKTKELLNLPGGKLESLSRSLAFRFAVEGYEIESNRVDGRTLKIEMTACPWRREIMKSKNEKLMPELAKEVCPVVYKTWAGEFLNEFQFRMSPQICDGGRICQIEFSV
jgi:hypothetical protein